MPSPPVRLLLLLALLWPARLALAQAKAPAKPGAAPILSGTVVDPSGAVVPGATVTLIGESPAASASPRSTVVTGPQGDFAIRGVPGLYTVVAQAGGFARFESASMRLGPGRSGAARVRTLTIRLKLEVELQQIDVTGDLDPSGRSGTTLVLSGRDLETMPLDTAALLDELQGLAGSKDAELYIDGFSGVKLPPRASIREVRINQNPYSAQNDTNPINGIIQVSTRPGTGQRHGEFYLYGDDSALNARNPFSPAQPPYFAFASGATLSGPFASRASYTVAVDETTNRTNSLIDAQVLDANLNQAGIAQALPSPLSTLTLSPRIDLQAGPRNTVIFRYTYAGTQQTNGGIGQLALATQAFHSSIESNVAQLSDSFLISPRLVDDLRLQYIRLRTAQTPTSLAPTVLVEGAFIGGGNNLGDESDHQDRVELQNYISVARGAQFFIFGGRLRADRDASYSRAGWNGEFIFPSLSAYQLTRQGIAQDAGEFTQTAGDPSAAVAVADAGIFFQDDWKLRPSLTLSAGLRFETQTYIPDHADWAPRLGFSWGFGHPGKASAKAAPVYVLHGGAGIFYRRFTTESALQVERQNGVNEQEYVLTSPVFSCSSAVDPYSCSGVPSAAMLAEQAAPTIYRVGPGFHAPYFLGSSVSLDRSLSRYGTASVTYLYNRGIHTQLTDNINAPLPGTYNPSDPQSGVRPLNTNRNIYEFLSEGSSRSSRLSATLTLRLGASLNLFGYYMLRYDTSDAESNGSFPSQPYNLSADFSRASGDIRHTATLGGNSSLPHGFHATGYLRALSGAPFNIVVGQDLNGDTQFNDRPAFATDLTRPSVVSTRWGAFDTSPIPGQTTIPRNFGQGPGFLLVNLAVGKSFAVGPPVKRDLLAAPKSSAAHKYTLDFWAESQNLLNHPNLGAPVGTLGSPLFGLSTYLVGPSALSPDRIVDLQMSVRF